MKYCFCVPQLPMSIVEFVDIVEGWDSYERRNFGRDELARPARCKCMSGIEKRWWAIGSA